MRHDSLKNIYVLIKLNVCILHIDSLLPAIRKIVFHISPDGYSSAACSHFDLFYSIRFQHRLLSISNIEWRESCKLITVMKSSLRVPFWQKSKWNWKWKMHADLMLRSGVCFALVFGLDVSGTEGTFPRMSHNEFIHHYIILLKTYYMLFHLLGTCTLDRLK